MNGSTKIQTINIISLIIGIMSLGFAGYLQFKDPQTGLIFFLGILIFIALYFIVSYLITKLMRKLNQITNSVLLIDEFKKDLNKVNDKLDHLRDTARLDARLSLIEKRISK